MRLLVILMAVCSIVEWGFSQSKNIVESEQLWLAYFNQARFTKRSGLWFDTHFRFTDDFVGRLGLTIFRPGYTFYLSDQARLTVGYAYVTAYSGSEEVPDIPEHRPWQQIQWFDKKKHFNMMQYLRLEERFRQKVSDGELIDEYQFSYRVRYNLSLTIPLTSEGVVPGKPFVFVSDELMVNFGKEIVYNYFDQNRFFVGVGYQFTKALNAHIGYLNVFLQRPTGNEFVNTHALRVFIFHNLDFRKEK